MMYQYGLGMMHGYLRTVWLRSVPLDSWLFWPCLSLLPESSTCSPQVFYRRLGC